MVPACTHECRWKYKMTPDDTVNTQYNKRRLTSHRIIFHSLFASSRTVFSSLSLRLALCKSRVKHFPSQVRYADRAFRPIDTLIESCFFPPTPHLYHPHPAVHPSPHLFIAPSKRCTLPIKTSLTPATTLQPNDHLNPPGWCKLLSNREAHLDLDPGQEVCGSRQ